MTKKSPQSKKIRTHEKIIFLFTFCVTFTATAQVKPNPYAAATIPPELLKNAHAVVRQSETQFVITNIGTATEKEHRIITILDEKSKDYNEQYFYYDKIRTIDDIEANVYDASGKLVRKLKRADISDVKAFEEGVDDSRYKHLTFPHQPYPYTIEYTVTTRHKGLFVHPSLRYAAPPNVAVESEILELTLAPDLPALRYKTLNGAPEPQITTTTEGKRYTWRNEKLAAIVSEPFAPPMKDLAPKVLTAPNDFQYEGFKGNMQTWQGFGAFIHQLEQNRQTLSAEKIAFIQNLVADCPDVFCKIEQIYAHLQNTTRYFSIQLGIGGLQTIAAADIERRKYGDCKALSNYMVSMLGAVGITGHSVVIQGGRGDRGQCADFPSDQFNHMIACVPLPNDTDWLECTSQSLPCGFLSNFTDNRIGVMVTSEGGKIARTPRYDERVNTAHLRATVQLHDDGTADANVQTVYAGIPSERAMYVMEKTGEERKKNRL